MHCSLFMFPLFVVFVHIRVGRSSGKAWHLWLQLSKMTQITLEVMNFVLLCTSPVLSLLNHNCFLEQYNYACDEGIKF